MQCWPTAQVVAEVHDVDGRLAAVCGLLRAWGLAVACCQQTSCVAQGYVSVIPQELNLFYVYGRRLHDGE